MKVTFAILLTSLVWNTQAQNVLQFDNNIELNVSIAEFELKKHDIDTCYLQEQPYFCKIDGNEWYGADMGMELPRYELKEIVLIHEGKKINLDISKMFNPAFSTTISTRHFDVKLINDVIQIYGWFSDGAGTYCAKWLVKNNSSKRILLSKSETDCFE
jgi:hypothetical protein